MAHCHEALAAGILILFSLRLPKPAASAQRLTETKVIVVVLPSLLR